MLYYFEDKENTEVKIRVEREFDSDEEAIEWGKTYFEVFSGGIIYRQIANLSAEECV